MATCFIFQCIYSLMAASATHPPLSPHFFFSRGCFLLPICQPPFVSISLSSPSGLPLRSGDVNCEPDVQSGINQSRRVKGSRDEREEGRAEARKARAKDKRRTPAGQKSKRRLNSYGTGLFLEGLVWKAHWAVEKKSGHRISW